MINIITFYVLFQTSFTIKSGVTDVAWKRFDIFMLDFNVFFEIAKTWGFVPAYMTNMKFTFFWMRVFFVLFQAVFQGMSKIALVAFPGFLCFMFIHDMLLKQLEILKSRKKIEKKIERNEKMVFKYLTPPRPSTISEKNWST